YLVGGQRVQQFVRDQHAFERVGQFGTGGGEATGDICQRGHLRGARGRARFDQVEPNRFVERRIESFRRAEDVSRQPPVPRACFDEIDWGRWRESNHRERRVRRILGGFIGLLRSGREARERWVRRVLCGCVPP